MLKDNLCLRKTLKISVSHGVKCIPNYVKKNYTKTTSAKAQLI